MANSNELDDRGPPTGVEPGTGIEPGVLLRRRWLVGERPEICEFVNELGVLKARELVAVLRVDQQQRWAAGDARPAEFYLESFPQLAADPEACVDLVYGEFLLEEADGRTPEIAVFETRFPEFASVLRQQVELHRAISGRNPSDGRFTDEYEHVLRNTLAMPRGATPFEGRAETSGSSEEQAVSWPKLPGYEILRRLGRGGSSVVYEARDLRLNRLVAIKMLSDGDSAIPDHVRRLRAEAEAVARLHHPNILQIHQVGEDDGRVYLILEHVGGGTLAQRVGGQPQEPQWAAVLVATLARATHVAHRHGIIHRDLKPANVLLDVDLSSARAGGESEFVPRIADFGLAKVLQPVHSETLSIRDHSGESTRVGDVLGTPGYMAPEQARGDNDAVGPAADIHALGAILYELLTGRPPYQGLNSIDILRQVIVDDPVAPHRLIPRTPRDLETICLKCLQKQAAQRYSSALELADDLQRFLNGEPIHARPINILQKAAKWMRRHPGAVVSAVIALILAAGILAGILRHFDEVRTVRMLALVNSLATAEPAAVTSLTIQLADYGEESWIVLEQAIADVPQHSRAWLNLKQAQLVHNPAPAAELVDYVPLAEADNIDLLKTALQPYRSVVRDRLWSDVVSETTATGPRLRAACVLADDLTCEDSRWNDVAEMLADELVKENPLHASRWAASLAPVSRALVPPLVDIFREEKRSAAERVLAAGILASHNSGDDRLLTELLLDATPAQYSVLLPELRDEHLVDQLKLALQEDVHPSASEQAASDQQSPEFLKRHRRQHRRRAIAAITLARLGHSSELERLLLPTLDPTGRSDAIELAAQLNLPPRWFVEQWRSNPTPGSRQAALLALGQYDTRAFLASQYSDLVLELQSAYHKDPDAGVHSAIGWILERWKYRVNAVALSPAEQPSTELRWFTNGQGQTYVILPAAVVTLGSPETEADHEPDESLHTASIERPFAMACCEVTVSDYLRFRPDAWVSPKYSPEAECPMGNLSWFDAAAYCRWLSEQEGVSEADMCFPPVDEIKPGMVLPEDVLHRTGYRMPTEAEWEYACRGGTNTSWSFGDASDLIGTFSRCLDNSDDRTGPVGVLLPNCFGLFDMHGNVSEWCLEAGSSYKEQTNRQQNLRAAIELQPRSIRGGSFGVRPLAQRSARRARQPANEQWSVTGLRPVRTLTHAIDAQPQNSQPVDSE
ncbi:MAG: bifunctional serine/threonine-protein kinase/formylglycine-generating enzyme family protein [Planctomycetaceae bacterium]